MSHALDSDHNVAVRLGTRWVIHILKIDRPGNGQKKLQSRDCRIEEDLSCIYLCEVARRLDDVAGKTLNPEANALTGAALAK